MQNVDRYSLIPCCYGNDRSSKIIIYHFKNTDKRRKCLIKRKTSQAALKMKLATSLLIWSCHVFAIQCNGQFFQDYIALYKLSNPIVVVRESDNILLDLYNITTKSMALIQYSSGDLVKLAKHLISRSAICKTLTFSAPVQR
jgi:hypothetical protein